MAKEKAVALTLSGEEVYRRYPEVTHEFIVDSEGAGTVQLFIELRENPFVEEGPFAGNFIAHLKRGPVSSYSLVSVEQEFQMYVANSWPTSKKIRMGNRFVTVYRERNSLSRKARPSSAVAMDSDKLLLVESLVE